MLSRVGPDSRLLFLDKTSPCASSSFSVIQYVGNKSRSRSHCRKLGLDILRSPLTDPGEKVTWKICPREGASIDEGKIQF